MLQYIPLIGGLIENWQKGRQEVRRQSHTEQMAVYEQFAAEFRDLSTRTWWDSLIDGVNRLPRPLMTFGIIWLFWLCWHDTETFIAGATALQAMPYEGWVALWMILGFWFGTKAIEKMPGKFGKLDGMKLPSGYKPPKKTNAPVRASMAEESDTDDDDHNQGITWEERRDNRYKKDWDNLND